ncbi:uncharacterized protein [Nicotiana tomentosiformis]|uniref:uncharacterized protein n=1 Tax=Nicotiana tomentosiformis TaxID=4098 RepID=UPI00388CA8F9
MGERGYNTPNDRPSRYNRFVMVGTIIGVEITESGNISGKIIRKRKKRVRVLKSEDAAEEEERLREEGGSGSGDASAAEGLFRLRKRFQESVSSVQEPLEDLLKRVFDCYNLIKKKSSRVKFPETARTNKKRKAASFIPVETPPTRGTTTRSQKKQIAADLERALEESRRKDGAKGKKKVTEPIEAIEIEEMDLVFHDKDKTEEVVTPKAKKRKISKKKSPSKTVEAEPSTLAKRTRSAKKSRKMQTMEEEESKKEEETDEEHDKMV